MPTLQDKLKASDAERCLHSIFGHPVISIVKNKLKQNPEVYLNDIIEEYSSFTGFSDVTDKVIGQIRGAIEYNLLKYDQESGKITDSGLIEFYETVENNAERKLKELQKLE